MRIIAGKWRGRPLDAPPGAATRPTADRVRETLFSMLASRLGLFEDLRVADLFAGSGALGFEALVARRSPRDLRGKRPQAPRAIRRNAEKLGAEDRPYPRRFGACPPRPDPFDLVFADPPYAPGSGTAVVDSVCKAGWLAHGGWISVETAGRRRSIPAISSIEATRDVGRARLTLLRRP